MKTKTFKYILYSGIFLFLVACSTRKNSFLSRNSHALSTEYNILYNGQIALDKGVESIKASNTDNFWKRLPIERMQFKEDLNAEGKPKNSDFELAETKATKAIQKHSMNIDGREKNSQIDEAYLLLGKSRYYDQRFIPALDAFNYILYKYPNSSNIGEAKIWREKTNMRLGNDALVVKNMSKLLDEKKLSKQVFSDANALLSEAFLNLEEIDSAVAKLKVAEEFSKVNFQKARYRFILGQLYEELGKKDSALYSYESVIAMKRKSERKYIIQAHAKKAQLFDYQNGDTTAFVKTYNHLISDRENRPFLDVIFYQMGVFYDNNNNQKEASHFYNASLKKVSTDQYLTASNYRNLGNMYFKNTDYQNAAKYYDSTLVKLELKNREYIHIKKVRENLDEVIEFEGIAKQNDSILNVVSLNENDRLVYFENYIEQLKKTDEAKKILEEKQKVKLENIARNSKPSSNGQVAISQGAGMPMNKSVMPPPSFADASPQGTANVFYFYNPTLVSFGKLEFKKTWGDRTLNANWRLSSIGSGKTNLIVNDTLKTNTAIAENSLVAEKVNEKYTVDYYEKQLPKAPTAIDSIAKERNSIYYQLGVIYKEKFKEYELATSKLEQLLQHNPEEKLVLPAMYNLYKIYQITDASKAAEMKSRISSQFPNSRYAQIINNTNPNAAQTNETPEKVYNKWYKRYQEEQFVTVLENLDALINQFSGDEIVSKFELLKANTIAKLKGVEAYKIAMQNVFDNYPNTEEGKKALDVLTTQIPFLEQMNFTKTDTKNWKILYKVSAVKDKNTEALEAKIKKLMADNNYKSLFYSFDNYTATEKFITIHGINSGEYAKTIALILEENGKYKVADPAIVMTNENYKVIQIKKNLDSYLAQIK